MQLRCTFCQTMFALSREEMLAALEHMEENQSRSIMRPTAQIAVEATAWNAPAWNVFSPIGKMP